MSTHNIGLYEEMVKIVFKLSSSIHFICSYEIVWFVCFNINIISVVSCYFVTVN